MKKLLLATSVCLALGVSLNAETVYVKGYTKSNGTYVAGHIRSSPNSTKADNYGPSTSRYTSSRPYARDHDGDGIANMYDDDDDNDGIVDDYDSSQYGR